MTEPTTGTPVETTSTPTPTTEDRPQSVSDWFRKTVTLPQETIEIFTDAQTAWEYTGLLDRQADIGRQLGVLRAKQHLRDEAGGVSIADVDPMAGDIEALVEEDEQITETKTKLMALLNESSIKVTLRALYPAEIRLLNREAIRRGPTELLGKDVPTPSENEIEHARNRVQNGMYLEKSVTQMRTAAGDALPAPSLDEWLEIEDTIDTEQYLRLINKMTQLNVRAAIKDARTDAGFPS